MELTVFRSGVPCGKAWTEEQGRRLRVRAVCEPMPELNRLYLLSDRDVLPLGVLLPESGKLMLERTVTPPPGLRAEDLRRAVLCPGDEKPAPLSVGGEDAAPGEEMPLLDRWMETGRPETFFRDEVLQGTVPGAAGVLYRYRAGCTELAFPASAHRHIAPALLFARPERIRENDYFVLRLSPGGLPLPAGEASTD